MDDGRIYGYSCYKLTKEMMIKNILAGFGVLFFIYWIGFCIAVYIYKHR